MTDRRQRLRDARLYLVCAIREDAFLEAALRGGVDIVQLRDKQADDAALVAAGRRYAALCAAHDALFILNDRPELVAAARADGVHVGQDDTPVRVARELVGASRIVGLSTHTPEQIAAAGREAVDYIGVGPVRATPTKPGRAAVGTALVREAAARAVQPFFAIGGIDAAAAVAVREAGAERIAVVRAITESADPEAAARRLRNAIAGATREARGARVTERAREADRARA
ncbi:MAG TPA: thiamine phosphate synthase [Solirubrobacteraceae bacterium]|nr:thiamine phosphate synthase [Solirubrobacteraceae bacterium]